MDSMEHYETQPRVQSKLASANESMSFYVIIGQKSSREKQTIMHTVPVDNFRSLPCNLYRRWYSCGEIPLSFCLFHIDTQSEYVSFINAAGRYVCWRIDFPDELRNHARAVSDVWSEAGIINAFGNRTSVNDISMVRGVSTGTHAYIVQYQGNVLNLPPPFYFPQNTDLRPDIFCFEDPAAFGHYFLSVSSPMSVEAFLRRLMLPPVSSPGNKDSETPCVSEVAVFRSEESAEFSMSIAAVHSVLMDASERLSREFVSGISLSARWLFDMHALELSLKGLYAVLHCGVRLQDLPCKFLSAMFLSMTSYHGTHADKEGCVMCQMRSTIEHMIGFPGDDLYRWVIPRSPSRKTNVNVLSNGLSTVFYNLAGKSYIAFYNGSGVEHRELHETNSLEKAYENLYDFSVKLEHQVQTVKKNNGVRGLSLFRTLSLPPSSSLYTIPAGATFNEGCIGVIPNPSAEKSDHYLIYPVVDMAVDDFLLAVFAMGAPSVGTSDMDPSFREEDDDDVLEDRLRNDKTPPLLLEKDFNLINKQQYALKGCVYSACQETNSRLQCSDVPTTDDLFASHILGLAAVSCHYLCYKGHTPETLDAKLVAALFVALRLFHQSCPGSVQSTDRPECLLCDAADFLNMRLLRDIE